MSHPFRDFEARRDGFGIAAGFEKPYNEKEDKQSDKSSNEIVYASVPHSGYYGVGLGKRPFKQGQAGFNDEIEWYKRQFGETTIDKK